MHQLTSTAWDCWSVEHCCREFVLYSVNSDELWVRKTYLIDSRGCSELGFHSVPIGFEHLNGHVVFKVLHEVHHALAEAVGALQRATHRADRASARLVLLPHTSQLALHVLAVEQVPEQQL
jgi:hypothetical protein